MRESQYVEKYLRVNGDRGVGSGITVSTFLNRELMGRAKDYSIHYKNALDRAIARRVAVGAAFQAPSKMGRVAFYPKALEVK